jgi:tetratricopeptide (TPR) repeat protein
MRREILTVEADPRSPERGQYAFVQALIREVAYSTLARADRKRRHLAAARFFEDLGTDELAGALAGHYLAAHTNAPEGPEAAALAAQSRIALRAAADRAAALGSHDQVLVFLRQALTVAADPSDEAEILERAGLSASAAAHHDEAESLLRRALDLHRARGDRPAIARATAGLGRALLTPYRTAQALSVLEPAASEFTDLGADPGVVSLLGQLARAYMLTDEDERAIAVADQALIAAEQANLVTLVADTLITKGTALAGVGRAYEGQAEIEGALRLAQREDLETTALRARLNLGSIIATGDRRAAFVNDRAGLAEARRLGQKRLAYVFLLNASESAIWTGDWDWAAQELGDIVLGDLEPDDRTLVLEALVRQRAWRGESVDDRLAEIARNVRESPDAQALFTLALSRANHAYATGALETAAAGYREAARHSLANAFMCHHLAASAALLHQDAGAARDDLRSMDAAGVHGPLVEAHRASILGGLAVLDGRSADAMTHYRNATRRFRDLGVPVHEAFTAIEMATLLDPTDPEVRATTEAAREILTRVGAKPFLEHLEAAVRRSLPRAGAEAEPARQGNPASTRSA